MTDKKFVSKEAEISYEFVKGLTGFDWSKISRLLNTEVPLSVDEKVSMIKTLRKIQKKFLETNP
jgi:hypothetical protein